MRNSGTIPAKAYIIPKYISGPGCKESGCGQGFRKVVALPFHRLRKQPTRSKICAFAGSEHSYSLSETSLCSDVSRQRASAEYFTRGSPSDPIRL